jgi:hypothetical protein
MPSVEGHKGHFAERLAGHLTSAEGNGYIAPPPCLPVSSSPASLHLPTTRRRLSCLIDGEVVCCDERGLATFQLLRHRRNEPQAFVYAFDLLELDGTDLRREPLEVRKATLASILRKSRVCG